MILTSQMTKDYYDKAQPLFDSVAKYWHDRFVLGCIDFEPEGYTGEYFTVKKEDIPSYRPDYPKNIKGFVTMQCGDFAKYIDCPDEEIIICIDADTVMQREITWAEKIAIKYLLDLNKILSVFPANPPMSLRQVLYNLDCKLSDNQLFVLYGTDWEQEPEFTTSILIAKKSFFKIITETYNLNFPKLVSTTEHHAGCQWLFNWACSLCSTHILPPDFQCASWYKDFDTKTIDGELYVNDKKVLFNHTKFNV